MSNAAFGTPSKVGLHENSVIVIGIAYLLNGIRNVECFQIALSEAGRAKHAIRGLVDRMLIEFLLCGIKQADRRANVLPAVFNFLQIDATRWLMRQLAWNPKF